MHKNSFLGFALISLLISANPSLAEIWVPPYSPSSPPASQPEKQLPEAAFSSLAQRRLARRWELGKVDPAEFKANTVQPRQGPTKAGFARRIQGFETTDAFQKAIEWLPSTDGGKVGLLSFTSPEALGLRIALRIKTMPEQARIRFFSTPEDAGKSLTGRDLLDHIQRNRAAGDPAKSASTLWSPLVEGDTLFLEIHLPPDAPTDALKMSIPLVSHIFLPEALEKPASGLQAKVGGASACNNDMMCDVNWTATSNSIARMIFTDAGSSYLCTGTLLNDLGNTGVPYFLSANHCISTQSVASTLITYWFYHSTACNSGILNPSVSTLNSGATLLYQSSTTDTSFMRLNASPPQGVTYSGWTTAAISVGAPSTSLSNPAGDMQKISYGQLSGFLTCTPPVNGSFTCQSAGSDTGTFDNIVFTSGITEPGSSGSGIFLNNGHYLYGQLYGGNSSCANPTGSNIYGRFDKAYASGNFSQWLTAGTYTLGVSKTGTGAGTISSSPSGINCGTNCTNSFAAGQTVTLTATPQSGSYFQGWSGACSGGGTCTLSMTTNMNAAANFSTIPSGQSVLTVSQTGPGSINSNPPGINCSGTCASTFPTGSTVTLTATPATGYYFSGWGGACAGSGSCTLTLNGNPSVTAIFTAIPQNNYLMTVTINGGGSVTSVPSGINCTTSCSYPFSSGTLVSLIASPNTGMSVNGWSGACSGKGSCSVFMNQNQSVGLNLISTYTLIMPAINLLLLE